MPTKYLLLAVLVGSASSRDEALSVAPSKLVLANTVWVPRTIAWEQPFPHDAEMSGIQYADFSLLCFGSQNQFMRVSSYHSRGRNDTIHVATEPGVSVAFGHYRVAPNRLVVTAKIGYRTIDFRPAGSRQDHVHTDTLPVSGQRLVYQGVEYRPYTKLAGQRIASFWAYAPSQETSPSRSRD
jgi:hypothetical protein